MTISKKNRLAKQTSDQQLVDGLTKHDAEIGHMFIGGKTYTVAQVVAIVLTSVTASKQVVIQRAAYEASLEAEKNAQAANRVFVGSLKQSLQAMYVGQVDSLADFGLRGRKPRVVSPKTQVAAAARAAATRKLRGTLGSRQKAKIQAPPVDVTTASPAEHAPPPATAPDTKA
jgi:hypothetical protein